MSLEGVSMVLILVLGLLLLGIILFSLIDIAGSNFKPSIAKVVFIILVIVAPVVGSILYLLLRKNYRLPRSPRNQ